MYALAIDIGEMPIVIRTESAEFARLLVDRYGEFVVGHAATSEETGASSWDGHPGHDETRVGRPCHEAPRLDVELVAPGAASDADDLSVRRENGHWVMERGDFRAEWDPAGRHGWVRQSAQPYAIDGVLRILHSLVLARQGGFLVHAASAVRNGRAFVFAGTSGTGKTTISRLAPPDVTLLTDEISCVRRANETRNSNRETRLAPQQQPAIDHRQSSFGNSVPLTLNPEPPAPAFRAFGTPFAGELARIGQKVEAPLAALFLLKQGAENRIESLSEGQAARELLRHVLFFAHDEELVGMVFQTVCEFVRSVPVCRLVFTLDPRVWELIL